MLEIAQKDNNLEKFRSDIAKVAEGEGKEGIKKEVDKLATLLDYNFDSRYSPALQEAMGNMKIER